MWCGAKQFGILIMGPDLAAVLAAAKQRSERATQVAQPLASGWEWSEWKTCVTSRTCVIENVMGDLLIFYWWGYKNVD